MRRLQLLMIMGLLCHFSAVGCEYKTLSDKLARFITPNSPGFSVLVAQKDKVLCRYAGGVANISLSVPLSTEHVFDVGSLTKQFTAVAILQLTQDKQLNLNDPISKFIKGIDSNKGTVTIKHLLSHTSGLVDPINEPEFLANRIQTSVTLDEMISMFKNGYWQFQPGERINYSNVGYSMLAYIIEQITQTRYLDALNTMIYAPAKMHNTSQASFDVVANKVTGYTFSGATPRHHDFMNYNWAYGAADLVSNPYDIYLFNRALMSGKLLDKAHLELFLAPIQLNDESIANGSFTNSIMELDGIKMITASGSTMGYSAHTIYIPSIELFIGVSSNSDGINGGNWIPPATLAEVMAADALHITLPTFSEINLGKEKHQKLLGQYQLPSGDIRTLSRENGQFYYQRNDGARYQVKPMAKNGFYFEDTLMYFFIRDDENHQQTMDFYSLLSSVPQPAIKI